MTAALTKREINRAVEIAKSQGVKRVIVERSRVLLDLEADPDEDTAAASLEAMIERMKNGA